MKRLPDVVHREPPLRSAAARSVGKVRAVSRTVVLERVAERFANVTLDFDGSVLSTGRHAEGTAVGFNKKKKGARSYYPLFAPWPRRTKCSPCTIDRETSTTPTAPQPSSSAVCAPCARASAPGELAPVHRSPVSHPLLRSISSISHVAFQSVSSITSASTAAGDVRSTGVSLRRLPRCRPYRICRPLPDAGDR